MSRDCAQQLQLDPLTIQQHPASYMPRQKCSRTRARLGFPPGIIIVCSREIELLTFIFANHQLHKVCYVTRIRHLPENTRCRFVFFRRLLPFDSSSDQSHNYPYSMRMSKPTLIFCPGAWYPPTAFNPLIDKLPEYTTHVVAFPSIQDATNVKDLRPDIEAVRSIVQHECNEGREVIVVSHSWSGLPVSSALDGLSRAQREKTGQKGGVVKLIFLSAFIPDVGQSLLQAFGGIAPDWYIRDVRNLMPPQQC